MMRMLTLVVAAQLNHLKIHLNVKKNMLIKNFDKIVRLLVATLHVWMNRKQDGGYTQSTQLQWDYLCWVKISFTHR